MNHVEWKGTHGQAGWELGSLLSARHYLILEHIPFAVTAERLAYAADCLAVYRAYFPEILEELEGLAEGQHCDVRLLQAVLFSTYAMPPSCHCSCFAAASEQGVVFGRNSDFLTEREADNTNVLYRLTDGGCSFTGNTTSFLQIEDGVNEHGLAVGLTSVAPTVRKPGFNAGLLVRYCLERCKTVPEALDCLQRLPVGSAQTLTLADTAGHLAVVECSAEGQEVIRPSRTDKVFVCATNTFHSPTMRRYLRPQEDDWFADRRYQTMRKALEGEEMTPVFSFAQALLSGRYGFLCQYDRRTGRDTVWSVIYDLGRHEIWRSEGNPAHCGYRQDERFPF